MSARGISKTAVHQHSNSLCADVVSLLSQIERAESELGLKEADVRSIRQILSNDTRTQIRLLRTVLDGMKECLQKYKHVSYLLEARSFLKSLNNEQRPNDQSGDLASDALLRDNLIQICDAVEGWRSTLTVPLPVWIEGQHIMFRLLDEVRSDVEEMVTSVALRSQTRGEVEEDAPPSSINKRKHLAHTRAHTKTALTLSIAMLPTCAHFPYALSADEHALGQGTVDRRFTTAYHAALQYLRLEYQRQVDLCRQCVELARHRQHLPLLECVYRAVGMQALPEHLIENEEHVSIMALRAAVYMFSAADKKRLFFLQKEPVRKSINVRAFLKGIMTPIPSYIAGISASNLAIVDQLQMLGACAAMKQWFSVWKLMVKRAEKRRQGDALRNKIERHQMKARLFCWYRFLTLRQSGASGGPFQRRKSLRRRPSSSMADSEPSPLASPHLQRRSLSQTPRSVEDAQTACPVLKRGTYCNASCQVGGRRQVPLLFARR